MASNVLGNAASGASAGASIGSVVPGIGTAIGGVVGGIGGLLGGLFGGDDEPQPLVSREQVDAATNGNLAALNQQNQFLQALAGQNGIGNQSSVFTQQQALANQLQDAANGGGPNPALDQLNQTTGQNVANQAALMAAQRGASQNAGLVARNAGIQGANTQQQAVGQAATLNAQQQIAARQQLMAQQQALAGLSGAQVAQQANATNAFTNGVLQNTGQLLNTAGGFSSGQQQGYNQLNAQDNQNANGQINGLIQGGGLAAMLGNTPQASTNPLGDQSLMTAPARTMAGQSTQNFTTTAAHGGMIKPEGGTITPAGPQSKAAQMLKGSHVPMKAAQGALVPGKPAKVDSVANDTVPAQLSPGEIVIPVSIAQGKNAPAEAAKFVAAILAKQSLRK